MQSRSIRSKIADYYELTKPNVWWLLVFTAIGAMIRAGGVGEKFSIEIEIIILVILATTCGTAGAEAISNYIDRDIDALMKRTKKRPIPTGRIKATNSLIFGLILGAALNYLLKAIDSYQEEVLLTLAGVIGGYALASHWHLSGPLAMVMVGLMVGNHGRNLAMSDKTRHYVDLFWELIDEILNAILFVLIGLEVVMIVYSANLLVAGVLTILIALCARLIVVGLTTTIFNKQLELPSGAWKVLTWGGLRGGISVALVLQLPDGAQRNILLALTYAVVVFSILVQGLSVGKVAKSIKTK